jgi:hypothetical protein
VIITEEELIEIVCDYLIKYEKTYVDDPKILINTKTGKIEFHGIDLDEDY